MRYTSWLALLILSLSCIMGCKGDQKSDSPEKATSVVVQRTKILPSDKGIQREMVERLASECVNIDYTFHKKAASMNHGGKSAVMTSLSHISMRALSEVPVGCQPDIRKVYWSTDGVLIEEDLYLQDGCQFIVFIQNERPLYANYLTPEGVAFYTKTLNKVAALESAY